MSCFGDVARRLQETALDEATKGKQYIHSCLSRKQYGEGLKADCCSTGSAFLGGKKCEEGRCIHMKYYKTAEGDDVGILDGSAAESALPHVEPVSGGVDEGKKPHIF
ncbi:hypothetical protein Bca101_068952 [Brassica carinata]